MREVLADRIFMAKIDYKNKVKVKEKDERSGSEHLTAETRWESGSSVCGQDVKGRDR